MDDFERLQILKERVEGVIAKCKAKLLTEGPDFDPEKVLKALGEGYECLAKIDKILKEIR
jgi:hypothetical protein